GWVGHCRMPPDRRSQESEVDAVQQLLRPEEPPFLRVPAHRASMCLRVEDGSDERWVLLAEDDGALRFLLASVLRKDGHRVLEVPDGEQLVVARAALRPGRTARTQGLSDRLTPRPSGVAQAAGT